MIINSLFLPGGAAPDSSGGIPGAQKPSGAGYLFSDIIKVQLAGEGVVETENTQTGIVKSEASSNPEAVSSLLSLLQNLLSGETEISSETANGEKTLSEEIAITEDELEKIMAYFAGMSVQDLSVLPENSSGKLKMPSLEELEKLLGESKGVLLTVANHQATVTIDIVKTSDGRPEHSPLALSKTDLAEAAKYKLTLNFTGNNEGEKTGLKPQIFSESTLSLKETTGGSPQVSMLIHEAEEASDISVESLKQLGKSQSAENETALKSEDSLKASANGKTSITEVKAQTLPDTQLTDSEKSDQPGKINLISNTEKPDVSQNKPVEEKANIEQGNNSQAKLTSEITDSGNTSKDAVKSESKTAPLKAEMYQTKAEDQKPVEVKDEKVMAQQAVRSADVGAERKTFHSVAVNPEIAVEEKPAGDQISKSVKENDSLNVSVKGSVKNVSVSAGTKNVVAETEVKNNLSASASSTQTADSKLSVSSETGKHGMEPEEKSGNRSFFSSEQADKSVETGKFSEILNHKNVRQDILERPEATKIVKAAELMKEISKFVQKQEKSSLTINIEPEHLGKVKIVLDVADKVMKATIQVDNDMVKQAVENNVKELQQSVAKSGIQLASINISLSNAEQKQNKHFAQKKKNSDSGLGQDLKVETLDELSEGISKKMGYNTVEYLA